LRHARRPQAPMDRRRPRAVADGDGVLGELRHDGRPERHRSSALAGVRSGAPDAAAAGRADRAANAPAARAVRSADAVTLPTPHLPLRRPMRSRFVVLALPIAFATSLGAQSAAPLTRSTPEHEGISSASVLAFVQAA